MIVQEKKLSLLLEMIDSGAYCSSVYFNCFGKPCKVYKNSRKYQIEECDEKCPFYNIENMMKWLKGE